MRAKIKRMIINPEAFIKIMSQDTAWRVKVGVPKTARLKTCMLDPHTGNIVLFIEDDSFPEIDLYSDVAPILETEFRKIQ